MMLSGMIKIYALYFPVAKKGCICGQSIYDIPISLYFKTHFVYYSIHYDIYDLLSESPLAMGVYYTLYQSNDIFTLQGFIDKSGRTSSISCQAWIKTM